MNTRWSDSGPSYDVPTTTLEQELARVTACEKCDGQGEIVFLVGGGPKEYVQRCRACHGTGEAQ